MTLTQTAILTKQVITLSIVAIVIGVVSFIGYQMWYSYYLSTLPPVEEKPDTKFGILPYPAFPKSGVSSSNFSYSLATVTGGLPKIGQDKGFDKLIKVFFVIKPYATFLSPDKSQALAEKFNITSVAQVVNETTYTFKQDSEQFKKTLTVDLDSGNFSYSKEASPGAEVLDGNTQLVTDFKNTLSRIGVLKDDLREGRDKVVIGDFVPGVKIAQVSLWPKDLDNKPIYSSELNKSNVSAHVSRGATNIENYLSMDFTYFQVDSSTFATYPTRLPEDAFSDLKNGKGVVIIEPEKPQVSITSVSLGYFLPDDYHPYIQPIYIFEGPNFVSYIPAVKSELLKED